VALFVENLRDGFHFDPIEVEPQGSKLICVHPEMIDFDSGHGGFAGDADKDRMKSMFRMAIRQGLFYRNGSYVGEV